MLHCTNIKVYLKNLAVKNSQMNVTVKQFAGAIDDKILSNPKAVENWKEVARYADQEDTDLVVFRIKRLRTGLWNSNLIVKIQDLIETEENI
jgi:hypothetical protein